LPEVVLERLTLRLADGCEDTAPTAWQWHARRTYLVDGTTVSTPDTPANQVAFEFLTQHLSCAGTANQSTSQ
jgi:hypothetical protein